MAILFIVVFPFVIYRDMQIFPAFAEYPLPHSATLSDLQLIHDHSLFGDRSLLRYAILILNCRANRNTKQGEKFVFGIVGLATGIGGIAEIASGLSLEVILGSADVIISGNDMYSATIDATDSQNVDIDLIKDKLVEKLGPEAGAFFEQGKVVLGLAGIYSTAKDLKTGIGVSLNFKDEKVMTDFLNLFGSSAGLSDDATDAMKLRDKTKEK